MFTPNEHFTIETKAGFLRCVPKTPETASAYKALQLLLVKYTAQIPSASRTPIDVNGIIGPSTTLAVQLVATRLAEGKYSGLSELAGAQPEEAIPYVAQNAMEIAGVFDQIVSSDPTALLTPDTGLGEVPMDPIAMLKGILTVPRIAAVGAVTLGLTGLALMANASDRRGRGVADRSGLLPESDGSDDFGDDEGHDEDGEADEEPEHAAA